MRKSLGHRESSLTDVWEVKGRNRARTFTLGVTEGEEDARVPFCRQSGPFETEIICSQIVTVVTTHRLGVVGSETSRPLPLCVPPSSHSHQGPPVARSGFGEDARDFTSLTIIADKERSVCTVFRQ